MNKIRKIFTRIKLISELSKIRAQMELNIPKSKQMLSNLIHNLIEEQGVCFKNV